MIVFDLRCVGGHVFEAWFGSSTAYEQQRGAGHLACPICGTAEVAKAVMAPAVAAKGNRRTSSPERPAAAADPAAVKQAIRALATEQARMLRSSEWVGVGFAGRARAMHDGDEPPATIHGQATLADARALAADGIPIAPLPFRVVPPDQVN